MALLITTRDQDVLDRSVVIREIKTLEADAAGLLLAACAGQDPSSPEAQEVQRHCGGLPLALAIVGGMVADGFSWRHLRDCLREADLRRLEFVLPNYRKYENLYRVLDASVSCLPDEERERYFELAVFEDRGQVPSEVAVQLWHEAGFGRLDSERLILRLSRRSLLQRSQAGRFTMHSLQFDYARHRLGEQGVRALHARMADTILTGWGGLDWDLPALRTSDLEEPAERYAVLNLAAHLGAAGRDRDIHQLLALDRPAVEVTGHHSRRVENTWYAVHERIGEIVAYSADVRLAWNMAKAAADRALAAAEPAAGIGLEVRYALLSASVSSLTASIPSELIVALVANGRWTAEEGLNHALRLPTAEAKARALTGLLALPSDADGPPVHAVQLAAEAATAAGAIDEPGRRASALTALAVRTPEPDRKAAIIAAWQAVCDIHREYPRAQACMALADAVRLPKAVVEEARALASKGQDPTSKVLILIALVPHLREPDRGSAADEAWQSAEGMPAGLAQARAFMRLAAKSPKSGRGAALDRVRVAIDAISRPEDKAAALTDLLSMVSAQASAEKDVLAAIEMISAPEAAVPALVALIPKVRANRRRDLIGQAIDLTGQIQQAQAKATALIALIGLVSVTSESREWQEKAARAIREISQPAARAVGYAALASHQPAEFRSATLALALAEACAIDDAGARAAGIAALVPHLPWVDSQEAGLDGRRAAGRAIDDARASGRRTLKVFTLTALAPALPEADRAAILKEASAEAYQVREPVDRAAVFTALLPSTVGPERAGAMEQACIAACAIGDPDLWRAALWSLMAAAPDALRYQAERVAPRAQTVLGRSADLNTALAACGLEPEECEHIAPAILADPALATDPPGILPPLTSAAKRAAVRRGAADVIAAISALHSNAAALPIMIAASAGQPPDISGGSATALAITRAGSTARSLLSIRELPELPGPLDDALREAIGSIEAAQSWAAGDSPRSGPVRAENPAPPAGPFPPWEPHWRAAMDTAAISSRTALISELSAMGAPMVQFGGIPAVEEAVKALLDVGRWWP